MTQQPSSPLVQGADTLDAVESQVEATLKVKIPDIAGLLRKVALFLPGAPRARTPQSQADLTVVGGPSVT